jgi:hypothetical protein
MEGIVIGARYKYRVEPSYRDDYFTRIDSYSFPVGAAPSDLLDGIPLRIRIDRGTELLFAQQFASGSAARSPVSTYFPDRLPVTAEKAVALKTGDYVRFATRMSLLARLGQVWPSAAMLLKADAGVSVVLDGQYQVHVFRLDESKVRLKLVAERGRRTEGGAAVSPLAAGLLDRPGQRLLPLARLADLDEFAAVAVKKSDSNLFLVDYTLDLARPEVAEAYSAIFRPDVQLTDIQVANPLRNQFDLRDRLLASIEDIDRLAWRDLSSDSAAVVRHFQGSNYSTARAATFHVQLKTFDATRERVYRQNFLTRNELTADSSEKRSYFLLPTWSHFRDRSMLFGMLDERQVRSADALFIADEHGRPVRFLNIGFGLDYSDERLQPDEYLRLRRKIELLLPSDAERELADLLSGTRWLEDTPKQNLSIALHYFFREAAFDGLVEAGYGDRANLEEALVVFIVRGIEDGDYPLFQGDLADLVTQHSDMRPASTPEELVAQARTVAGRVWRSQIARTAESLSQGFTAGGDTEKRMQAVLALRSDAFYQRVGTAFWAELVQDAGLDLKRVMFLSLELQADDHQGVSFTYGEPGERDLYDSVKFIQTILNDRSLDMREPGDLDPVISRMTVVQN